MNLWTCSLVDYLKYCVLITTVDQETYETRIGSLSHGYIKNLRLEVAAKVNNDPCTSFVFGVRIMLGTILGRFSIIYFRGLGLRIMVMVWVMVRARVRVWARVGVRVSVVLWSWQV